MAQAHAEMAQAVWSRWQALGAQRATEEAQDVQEQAAAPSPAITIVSRTPLRRPLTWISPPAVVLSTAVSPICAR